MFDDIISNNVALAEFMGYQIFVFIFSICFYDSPLLIHNVSEIVFDIVLCVRSFCQSLLSLSYVKITL